MESLYSSFLNFLALIEFSYFEDKAIDTEIEVFDKNGNPKVDIVDDFGICENENCNCEEEGIVKSSLKHTIQIFTYIILISLIINFVIYFIGEENIANLIVNNSILGTLIASAIGIIPNCASSIILTELYLKEIITLGPMIAGVLVNSGIGILILFKVNKNKKDNLSILGILYLIGILSGIFIELMM